MVAVALNNNNNNNNNNEMYPRKMDDRETQKRASIAVGGVRD